MKFSVLVLMTSLCFHTSAFALDSIDLAQAWVDARFTGCDPNFVDAINIKNVMTLNAARKGVCADANLKDLSSEKTLACFKTVDSNLRLNVYTSSGSVLKEYGCKEKPEFAEYISGDKKALKPADPVYSASVACTPSESRTFKWQSAEGKAVCTNKYSCTSKFKFGESTLEPGTYFLRCNDKASSQADCDKMTFYECEGKEVSYAKVSFGIYKSDSTAVKASKAPAAQ